MKRAALIFILSVSCLVLKAQNRIVDDFMPLCDTLAVLIQEHSGVKGEVELKGIMKRGSSLDFYFSETLGDFPWYKGDVKWFRNRLKSLFPDEYRNLRLGEIYSRRVSLDCLEMPGLTCNGRPAGSRYRVKPASRNLMIVRRPGAQTFSKGLSGRHIALWQSHGRYYDHNTGIWTWQRPCLFGTCEDMFTQSFVLQYLVPMLENAGAYVMLPRERDIQTQEIIADNDSTAGKRGKANYEETGRWATSEEGFADLKPVYEDCENPFKTGTSRTTRCTTASVPSSTARWTPEIPDRGKYAVYVSYRSFPNSSTAAHYTVSHMGGTTEFAVNQKMGAGTWIYLGTFEFEAGTNGCVTLDNLVPKGHQVAEGSCISADAVKFGGGMGNISRNGVVSGMPRSAEGARYWLQWAGADTTVYYQNGGKNDYKDDFMSRGDWAEWISRGSRIKPEATGGLGIPVDLTMGFHSDAGVTPNDSLVGTLAIYTYRSDGKTELPSGEDRLTSRMFADIVQNQVVRDIRAIYDTLWTRRSIWDRAYRESRTPSSPAIILELLSHQNFADMKYGLDPSFRFDVSRAVYKGMLKYLSNRYGCEYAVQPLPVSSAGATFGKDGKAIISWKPEKDPLEPTADPDGYILYTRISDGCFDQGTIIKAKDDEDGYCRCEVELIPGEVMSFKIAAFNAGGEGFASETISIGTPLECAPDSQTVLIVNNFDRVSGPAVRDGEGNV